MRNGTSNASICTQYLRRGEGEGENGDVILLAELLGSVCNLFCWLGGESRGPVEPEEFSSQVAGLDHAVGDDGEREANQAVELGYLYAVIGEVQKLRGAEPRRARE